MTGTIGLRSIAPRRHTVYH